MPSGPRIRTDNVFGTTTDNPLTNGATTINSAGLANLAAVSSAHAILVLDPLRSAGAPEMVVVTAHTSSATSATITRGAYGTAARQHASGTLWLHAPTIEDAIRIVTAATRPSDPYEGQMIYETDTDRLVNYNGSAWVPASNMPRAEATRNSNQSITNNAWNLVTFNVEDVDTDTLFTTGSGDRFTAARAGRYQLCFTGEFDANSTGARGWAIASGVVAATNLTWRKYYPAAAVIGTAGTVSGDIVLAASGTCSLQVFQNSGGALNLNANTIRATIRWVALT